MIRFVSFISLIVVFVLSFSCKKDDEIKTPVPLPATPVNADGEGTVLVNFKALVNGKPLVANTEWYTNLSLDSFTISKFNYYISNIKMIKTDGSIFFEKNSYHLNKHVGGAESFNIANVPAGTYTSIEFLIGVDSIKNVSGAQSGILNEGEDMYWTWNTGYIFYKLEGMYKTSIQTEATPYGLHVGGFQAGNNCLRKSVLEFSTKNLAVSKQHSSQVFIHVNVEQVFDEPSPISLNEYNSIFTSKMSQAVASNYEDMFVIHKIEN